MIKNDNQKNLFDFNHKLYNNNQTNNKLFKNKHIFDNKMNKNE